MAILADLDDDRSRHQTLKAASMQLNRPYIVECLYAKPSVFGGNLPSAVANLRLGRGAATKLYRVYLPIRYNTAQLHDMLPMAFPLGDMQLVCERVLKLASGHETPLLRFKKHDVKNTPEIRKSYQLLLRALANGAGTISIRKTGVGGGGTVAAPATNRRRQQPIATDTTSSSRRTSTGISRSARGGGGRGASHRSPGRKHHRKVDSRGRVIESDSGGGDDDDNGGGGYDDGYDDEPMQEDDGVSDVSSGAAATAVDENQSTKGNVASDGGGDDDDDDDEATDLLLAEAAERAEKLYRTRNTATTTATANKVRFSKRK